MKHTPLPRKAAVALVVMFIVLLLVFVAWWVGDRALSQFGQLKQRLPDALDAWQAWLQQSSLGSALASSLDDIDAMSMPWANVAGFTSTAIGALANTILIIAIGVYVAGSPKIYGRGLIRLMPPAYRATAQNALAEAFKGLRLWLVGQLLAMVIVGVLTAIGLRLLDIPLALSLGIIAGLLEFVPIIGPITFGVLAVLLAFTDGPSAALHVALLVLAIQQLETNAITPIVQRRAVELPPALGLVSVVIFGVLFGIPGVLFATPLMVVAMILVQKLYIEDALESRTPSGAGLSNADR